MRLSVACNFDDALIDGLKGLPVYELYGKVTEDYAGGGRPSFYLPRADEKSVERMVGKAHANGIQFNYLLNASCMGNRELTREGQHQIRKTLDWVSDICCDSVTVGNIYLLQMIKKCYPTLKVRISAHRFTDSPRKARFWEEHGADCIVINEVAYAREFSMLRAIRESVKCDLSLIVNNSCRQDCAIAGTHSTSMSHGSQAGQNGYSLDYHMLFCLDYRLRDPVNFVRANWIRPDDIHHYEALGFDNFKIVERNTPTPVLLQRARAYAARRFDGNLFDLVLPFQYPAEAFTTREAHDAYSFRRAVRYFFKPGQVNVSKVFKINGICKHLSLLYPRRGAAKLYLDNRKLDGFIDRFLTRGCTDLDCEKCHYCHEFAARALTIDPKFREEALGLYRDLFADMHEGGFWETHASDYIDAARLTANMVRERILPLS